MSPAKLQQILQTLKVAKQRQKLDPRDTMETSTYIAQVEALLFALGDAHTINRLQSANIRAYIEQHQKKQEKETQHVWV